MQVINRTVSGPVTLSENTELWGTILGDVRVSASCKLEVKGRIEGDVTVEKDALLQVDGAVIGDVQNAGRVEVYGILRGQVVDYDGEIYIDERAMIL